MKAGEIPLFLYLELKQVNFIAPVTGEKVRKNCNSCFLFSNHLSGGCSPVFIDAGNVDWCNH